MTDRPGSLVDAWGGLDKGRTLPLLPQIIQFPHPYPHSLLKSPSDPTQAHSFEPALPCSLLSTDNSTFCSFLQFCYRFVTSLREDTVIRPVLCVLLTAHIQHLVCAILNLSCTEFIRVVLCLSTKNIPHSLMGPASVYINKLSPRWKEHLCKVRVHLNKAPTPS